MSEDVLDNTELDNAALDNTGLDRQRRVIDTRSAPLRPHDR